MKSKSTRFLIIAFALGLALVLTACKTADTDSEKTPLASDALLTPEAEELRQETASPEATLNVETPEAETKQSEELEELKSDSLEAQTESLDETFPVENAKRAAVVAITNFFASDVFEKDGNTFDPKKFHSYADNEGNFFRYYLYVDSPGNWSVKDKKSRHVDSLKLENGHGIDVEVSMDVDYDGENYTVSNFSGKYGQVDIATNVEAMMIHKNADRIPIVSAEQISKDRQADEKMPFQKWVDSQFSGWDGSHRKLNELIKEMLNDEKSFDPIKTTYVSIIDDSQKNEVNKILKTLKRSERLDIGDLWITVEFAAKNTFNATVKGSAYGISSYKNDSLKLIEIE